MKKDDAHVLMSRAKSGDREAFDEIIHDFRPRLIGFIRARLGNHLQRQVDPEDIFQDAVLRAFQSLGRFQWKGHDPLFSWLATVTEYVIRDQSRWNRRRPTVSLVNEPVADQDSPSKFVRREERFDRLEHALQELSEDHRRVIRFARIDKLPVTEIARRMKRSKGAVRHLLLRALENLRAAFGDDTESLHLPDRTLREAEENTGE